MHTASHHRPLLLVLALVLTLTVARAMNARVDDDAATIAAPTVARPIERIAVNTATATELATLPGVGPRLAERIIAERGRRGGFCALRELDEVRGVGPALLRRIANRLEFHSQIDGPTRACDQRYAVPEAAVEVEGGVRSLDAQAEVPLR